MAIALAYFAISTLLLGTMTARGSEHSDPGNDGLSIPCGARSAGDITLDTRASQAYTIRGVVIGDEMEPVPRARVTFQRENASQRLMARTDAEGRFELDLGGTQAFALTVECDGYYQFPWRSSARFIVTSASPEIRVSVMRKRQTRFRIIDNLTELPVALFHVAIAELPLFDERGARSVRVSGDKVVLREHAEGAVDIVAEPRLHAYRVVAPGYAAKIGFVAHADASRREQVIRLVRGSTITGFVSRKGVPLMGASVWCIDEAGGWISEEISKKVVDARSDELVGDLADCFEVPRPHTLSDETGRFEFRDLAEAVYSLEIAVGKAETLQCASRYVAPGTIVKLGVIELGE